VFGNPQFWVLFRNSLTLAALTTSLAGIAGVILGVLIIKTDMPVGTLLAAGFSLPLLFPPYILAVGWFEILGRGGILSRWTNPAIGEMTSRWFFGFPGAVVVLASAFMPIVLLLTITYLRSVSPTLEEAAQLSYGPFAVLRQMMIPLIRPGIVLALTLAFLLTMGECGAPAFLRLNVFPVASFTQLSAFYNFGAATAAATPLIGVLLAGLLVEQKALGQRSYSFRWVRPEMTALIPLGRKRIPALVAAITLASLFVGIPMAGVLWRGSSAATLSEAITRGANSAVRSVLYAAAAATLISALGFFLAYSVHRRAIASVVHELDLRYARTVGFRFHGAVHGARHSHTHRRHVAIVALAGRSRGSSRCEMVSPGLRNPRSTIAAGNVGRMDRHVCVLLAMSAFHCCLHRPAKIHSRREP
jgi:iron(III) transport system permease protein